MDAATIKAKVKDRFSRDRFKLTDAKRSKWTFWLSALAFIGMVLNWIYDLVHDIKQDINISNAFTQLAAGTESVVNATRQGGSEVKIIVDYSTLGGLGDVLGAIGSALGFVFFDVILSLAGVIIILVLLLLFLIYKLNKLNKVVKGNAQSANPTDAKTERIPTDQTADDTTQKV